MGIGIFLQFYFASFELLKSQTKSCRQKSADVIQWFCFSHWQSRQHLPNVLFVVFFLSYDLHILQTTCITNKNITKNSIWKTKQHKPGPKQSDTAPIYENFSKLYFDAKRLEEELNRQWWNFWCPFFKKCLFGQYCVLHYFSKLGPASTEPYMLS